MAKEFKTKEEILKNHIGGFSVRLPTQLHLAYIKAMNEYADQFRLSKALQIEGEKIQKENRELKEALKQIEQCSDSGSYERAIVDMKAIATNALKH